MGQIREWQTGSWGERARRWGMGVALLGYALLGLGGPAAAAAATFGRVGSLGNPSTDPTMIAPQLRQSVALQERAMEQLNAPQIPETRQGIWQLLNQAYVLTRAAHSGIDRKIARQRGNDNQGHVDPTLVWQDQMLTTSRKHILRASSGLRDPSPTETRERMEQRIADIEEAIRHIRRVLATVR